MEIKQLLEIMLNNVNEGREATYGLIGYNGTISVHNPEQVHRKPHTYITFDEFREIRNTPDHNTAHYRLNLAIEKLMVVHAEPVMPAVIPEGYVWDRVKGGGADFYGKFIAKGWTDAQLIDKGYLLPVQKPTVEAPEFFKPFIAWVCGGCNHVWPKADYLFTESQFSNIKNSEFRVKLVAALNLRIEDGNPFNHVVSNISIGETFDEVKRREELVNKRLNEIIQKL